MLRRLGSLSVCGLSRRRGALILLSRRCQPLRRLISLKSTAQVRFCLWALQHYRTSMTLKYEGQWWVYFIRTYCATLFAPCVSTHIAIFLSAPLLGPALGPIIGGALTQAFNWRATFWFIAAFSGLCLLAFVFFSDTFRRERSLTYQTVLRRRLQERARHEVSNTSGRSSMSHDTVVSADHETRKEDKMDSETSDGVPPVQKPAGATEEDLEAQKMPNINAGPSKVVEELKEIRLSFKDINPIRPIFLVLSRRNNLAILFSSGLYWYLLLISYIYSFQTLCDRVTFCIQLFLSVHMFPNSLTEVWVRCADHRSCPPFLRHWWETLFLFLNLCSCSAGSVLGSVLGGRWSDGVLAYLKSKNGGVSHPEVRSDKFPLVNRFLISKP